MTRMIRWKLFILLDLFLFAGTLIAGQGVIHWRKVVRACCSDNQCVIQRHHTAWMGWID